MQVLARNRLRELPVEQQLLEAHGKNVPTTVTSDSHAVFEWSISLLGSMAPFSGSVKCKICLTALNGVDKFGINFFDLTLPWDFRITSDVLVIVGPTLVRYFAHPNNPEQIVLFLDQTVRMAKKVGLTELLRLKVDMRVEDVSAGRGLDAAVDFEVEQNVLTVTQSNFD